MQHITFKYLEVSLVLAMLCGNDKLPRRKAVLTKKQSWFYIQYTGDTQCLINK